jgi:hypothetical protein
MAPRKQQGSTRACRAVRSSRLEQIRRSLHQTFHSTSVAEVSRDQNRSTAASIVSTTKDFFPSPLAIPQLSCATTVPAAIPTANFPLSPCTPSSIYSPITSVSITRNSLQDMQQTMSLPQTSLSVSNRLFVGVDPERQYSAEPAATTRRHRPKNSRHRNHKRTYVLRFSRRKQRSRIIACCLSAIFLTIVLSICEAS